MKQVYSKDYDDNARTDDTLSSSYAIHLDNRLNYGAYLRPLSIIVCHDIAEAIRQWSAWVTKFVEEEKITLAEARERVIWVSSGLPNKNNAKAGDAVKIVESLDGGGESWRNKYVSALAKANDSKSVIEVIVSVGMLTEGWDVKRVFQIVPHEERAFASRLLISQILGRGLRMPETLKGVMKPSDIKVTVNNHAAWYPKIRDLFEEILEIKERASYGFDGRKTAFADIVLHNMIYEEKTDSQQTTGAATAWDKTFSFETQKREHDYTLDIKNLKDNTDNRRLNYRYVERDIMPIMIAARKLYEFIKDRDEAMASKYPPQYLAEKMALELESNGSDTDFLTERNLNNAKSKLGPHFRKAGEKVAVYSQEAGAINEVSIADFPRQSFSESMLRKVGYFYYDDNTLSWYDSEDEKRWMTATLNLDEHCKTARLRFVEAEEEEEQEKAAKEWQRLKDLQKDLRDRVKKAVLKTPLNAIYVSYEPEHLFMEVLTRHAEVYDWFIKSADKGFYGLPYAHQAEGSTHSRHDNFHPDFFIKVAQTDHIVVVEIKKEGDLNARNRAKYRDASAHFKLLNLKLEALGSSRRYYFKFLSDDKQSMASFMEMLKDGRYKETKTKFMADLERGTFAGH